MNGKPKVKIAWGRLIVLLVGCLISLIIGFVLGMAIGSHKVCVHDWMDADCLHGERCRYCTLERSAALGHDWQEAGCEEPKTCLRCGETEGDPIGHSWSDAACESPKMCTRCGATDGKKLGHDWDKPDCSKPKTCKRCGRTDGEAFGHSWVDATCLEAEHCARCGKTRGEALGHDWTEATYGAPKTCKYCGETEGEALTLEGSTALDLMNITKADFKEATGDATYSDKGCSACHNNEEDTLVSSMFPNYVLAFHSEDTSTPRHIHVYKGQITVRTKVGMTYGELHDVLGDAEKWGYLEAEDVVYAKYTVAGVEVWYYFDDIKLNVSNSNLASRPASEIRVDDTSATIITATLY